MNQTGCFCWLTPDLISAFHGILLVMLRALPRQAGMVQLPLLEKNLRRHGANGMSAAAIRREDHTAGQIATRDVPLPRERGAADVSFRSGDGRQIAQRRSGGLHRQAWRDWVHRYNALGVTGLSHKRQKAAAQRCFEKAIVGNDTPEIAPKHSDLIAHR